MAENVTPPPGTEPQVDTSPDEAGGSPIAWLILVAVASVYAGLFVPDLLAERQGTADAEADVAQGVYSYRLGGLRRQWEEAAVKLAWDRYGVKVHRTGGCVIQPYDFAYNRVLDGHLKARFGFDPVMKACDDAREEWERQRTDSAP
jgi:hypothetical protein